ncbi:hypothetical protein PR048_027461 [Dryococelus australis]|uniref:Uncharacterized protein n=1 Tax=Dryococelus australis TaxID=614101 RepID=A0ABQ9GGP1_9NEOP|nr:hypothetical protein PR048_027461 [Dryococelus australis]
MLATVLVWRLFFCDGSGVTGVSGLFIHAPRFPAAYCFSVLLVSVGILLLQSTYMATLVVGLCLPPRRTGFNTGRAMPLVGGFSRGYPVSSALAFWSCSLLISFYQSRLSRPRCEADVFAAVGVEDVVVPLAQVVGGGRCGGVWWWWWWWAWLRLRGTGWPADVPRADTDGEQGEGQRPRVPGLAMTSRRPAVTPALHAACRRPGCPYRRHHLVAQRRLRRSAGASRPHAATQTHTQLRLISALKTVAPFEFRAGLEIEIKFISNRRNWRFEISIRDQKPSSTNADHRSQIGDDVGATGSKSRLLLLQERPRPPASSQDEPGSIPGQVTPRVFARGNRVRRFRWSTGFLGDIPFPPPFHSDAVPYSPRSFSSTLKTSMLRAVQIYQLNYTIVTTNKLQGKVHKWMEEYPPSDGPSRRGPLVTLVSRGDMELYPKMEWRRNAMAGKMQHLPVIRKSEERTSLCADRGMTSYEVLDHSLPLSTTLWYSFVARVFTVVDRRTKRVAREVTSGREICDCEHHSSAECSWQAELLDWMHFSERRGRLRGADRLAPCEEYGNRKFPRGSLNRREEKWGRVRIRGEQKPLCVPRTAFLRTAPSKTTKMGFEVRELSVQAMRESHGPDKHNTTRQKLQPLHNTYIFNATARIYSPTVY